MNEKAFEMMIATHGIAAGWLRLNTFIRNGYKEGRLPV
jgi:hypothetical protein